MSKRVFLIVLDSFGMGELPDAASYGDAGSNTLLAVANSPCFAVPELTHLGLFNIDGAKGEELCSCPSGSFARIAEKSVGKDTTVGHWEIAGLCTATPFPTYPDGFPKPLMDGLKRMTGRDVLCCMPYSGTDVIRDFGDRHMASGALIVYTSSDSVLQIAAHEDIISLDEQYQICMKARDYMRDENAVARIIARPFLGQSPDFYRTGNRRDFALAPPSDTMLDVLSGADFDVLGVGKISDIFAGKGLTRNIEAHGNDEGMKKTIEAAKSGFNGLCFINLVDFDTLYGHRNDADGYARAISRFDAFLPELMGLLLPDDILIITADHGCDPSTASTDHSREYTPCLIYGEKIKPGINLGTRSTMADIGATVLDYFGLVMDTDGRSFLRNIM